MSTVTESVDVEVPVHTAYNQWTQFEEFPNFMEGVEQVTQLDDRHNHWITSVSGARREFDTEIVDQLPDERVAWRTVSGDVKQKGVVTFQQLDEGHTRIRLGVPHRQPHLDPGHVLVQAWRSALALRVRGPDQGPALQRGPAAQHQRPLDHDQGRAEQGPRPLTWPAADAGEGAYDHGGRVRVASPLSPSARDRRGCGARHRAQAWTQGNSDRALGGHVPGRYESHDVSCGPDLRPSPDKAQSAGTGAYAQVSWHLCLIDWERTSCRCCPFLPVGCRPDWCGSGAAMCGVRGSVRPRGSGAGPG